MPTTKKAKGASKNAPQTKEENAVPQGAPVLSAEDRAVEALRQRGYVVSKPGEEGDLPPLPVPHGSEGEPMVEMFVDPKLTEGGLRTNETRYVGHVRVPKSIAVDLQRRIDEYAEMRELRTEGNAFIRQKSSFTVSKLFLADPAANKHKKGWTDLYGLLDPRDWQFQTKAFRKELIELREQLYGFRLNYPDLE